MNKSTNRHRRPRSRRARTGIVVGLLLASAGMYLLFWPVPIDAVAWRPAADPGFTGPFARNDALATVEILVEVGGGPEAAARGRDGLIYTGLQDGRIVRFDPESDAPPQTFADTGGRPLGLQFDRRGDRLIVADAFRGLLAVAPDGAIEVLVGELDGVPLKFANDLDIGADGTIWFTDSSQRFDQHDYMLDLVEGRPTGRLLRYDPASGETSVHLEGLGFPNGVAIGPGETYVLVAETLYARITRYEIADGERRAAPFVEALPGYPDNLSLSPAGDLFWVALPASRSRPLERLAGWPRLREMLLRVPGVGPPDIEPLGWVIGLSESGEVRYDLQDHGGIFPTVTSATEIDGYLYLGSIASRAVARIPVPRR